MNSRVNKWLRERLRMDSQLAERIIMGQLVCGGASLTCSFGAAPGTLNVLPANRVTTSMPIANIMDNKPLVNIMPFGMCSSPANPMVASATAAALGVLTPMPCIPVTAAPWVPGSPTVLVGNMPALNASSKCMCNWGGMIQPAFPGQMTIQVP
nr:DUF4280 domain-containing protein [Paenibacillus sp. HB172176]